MGKDAAAMGFAMFPVFERSYWHQEGKLQLNLHSYELAIF